MTGRCSLVRLRRAVDALLQKDVIERVHDHSSLGFYSRLFLVPKRSGEDRPVIDLSILNRHLHVPSFRMETQASVREAIRPGEWVASIDIRDAYLHVPMARNTRRYLRFVVGREVFQFKALPFGLSTSPREFTKLLEPVVRWLRLRGIRVHAYLDDWLVRGPSQSQAVEKARSVVSCLRFLGWVINEEKSSLTPSQEFTFLGMRFNTSGPVVLVSPSREVVQRLETQLLDLRGRPVTARQLASLMGLLKYMAPMIRRGMLHLRPLQWAVKDFWVQATGQWSDVLTLPSHVWEQFQWFTQPHVLLGVPTVPPEPTMSLCTDASGTGWGANLGVHRANGLWSTQGSLHSNIREMLAVEQALLAFKLRVKGRSLRVFIDNKTVVYYIRCKGGTRSRDLNDLSLRVWELADSLRCHLHPVYIKGMLNVEADLLSRSGQVLETEWCLDRSLLREIFGRFGNPVLDLFATYRNTVVARFFSPFPDPRAVAVDALALDWSHQGLVYAFPPWKLVPEVIRKWEACEGTDLILIAPLRGKDSWVPELVSLAVDRIDLGAPAHLLFQEVHGAGLTFHQNVNVLALHAWKLSKN